MKPTPMVILSEPLILNYIISIVSIDEAWVVLKLKVLILHYWAQRLKATEILVHFENELFNKLEKFCILLHLVLC